MRNKKLNGFLTCPFCGSDKLNLIEEDKNSFGVSCSECNFDFPDAYHMLPLKELNLKWNMRVKARY